MKYSSFINKLMAISVTAFIAACGDNDSDPVPMVDCNATGPTLSLTATDTDCGEDDGQLALNITGGTGTLEVTIDPQPIDVNFANNTFTDLEPGTYTVEVTDDDNCSSGATATINFTAGNTSYQTSIDPIVQAKCAITGCHVDGNQLGIPDFTNFSTFQGVANNDAGGVRPRVKSDDMPRDPNDPGAAGTPLTDEEKAAIFCWIDEGAQDN